MSISYLLSPNDYGLYSKTLTSDIVNTVQQNVQDLFTNSLDATTLNASTVISNTLQTTTGSNYLGLYSSSKVYKLGDQVIFNNLLYRCLVNDTTGIAPDPNNPAQAQWVALTSNNAVKNDLKYLQVSVISGDDNKALISPAPFKTIQAALNFGGSGSYVILIDTNSTYSTFNASAFDNVVIDGGGDGTFDTGGNVVETLSTIFLGNNTTLKNITIKDISTSNLSALVKTLNKVNTTIDNVVFDSKIANTATEIYFETIAPQTQKSDIIIYNCRTLTELPDQYLNIRVSTTTGVINTALLRVFLFNIIGPVGYLAQSADIENQELQQNYINNCKNIISCNALAGSFYINDCNFTDYLGPVVLVSSATTAAVNNKLVISNSSMFSSTSTTYARINKSGDCPYLFVNFDYDRDGSNTINGTPIADLTSGPATYFNQPTSWGTPGTVTTLSIGLTTTADKLNIPTLDSDPFNIIGATTANSFIINYTGVYEIVLNVESATTTTTGQDGIIDVFIGLASNSNIASAYARNTMTRGLVSNASTYPTNNYLVSFKLPWAVSNTNPLSVYARNTNTQAFNLQIVKMSVMRLRKV
jgi:hypothetical protein